MSCEPDLRSGEERRRGCALLVGEGFGVGESGEAIDGRVQVDVAAFGSSRLCPGGGLRLAAVAAVDAPPATIGDPADFLPVEVDHVPGPPSGELAGLAAGLAAWGYVTALCAAPSWDGAGDGPAVE